MATKEKLQEVYKDIVNQFVGNVKKLNTQGIPAPNIPKVGASYDDCSYKIAFIGMETKGWGKLSKFIELCKNAPEEGVTYKDQWFDEGKRYKHLKPTTFWGFIVSFLAKFYGYNKKQLIHKDGTYHPILSSFVWGNCNSLERYCVTAKKNAADKKDWLKIKEFSLSFDKIVHILEATKPQLIFITYARLDKVIYFQNVNWEKVNTNKELHLQHYIIKGKQQTNVFVIPHPTWIVRSKCYGGYKKYINELINYIKECKIWSTLPIDK